MELRPYEEPDEDRVVALWRECGLVVPWNDPHADIARKLTTQRELFVVAVAGAEVVGTVMAGYDGHRGWVNYLAVAPSRRYRGLGRRLMEWVEARLAELGCAKVNVQVREGNAGAMRFYEAIGYRQDDVVSFGRRLTVDAPARARFAAAPGCVPYAKWTRMSEVEDQ